MEKIEKTLRYTKLFNLYGTLLSSAQQEMLSDYFFADLSISEISENRNVSLAAIEDALSKGMARLDSIEESLKMCEKKARIAEKTQELHDMIEDPEQLRILDEIMGELD